MATKRPAQIDLKTFRKQFAALRRKKLVSAPSKFFKGKEAPIRSVAPTKARLAQIKKFSDVLTGRAVAIAAKRVVPLTKKELVRVGARRIESTPRGPVLIVRREPGQQITTKRKQIVRRVEASDLIILPHDVEQFTIDDLDPKLLPKPSRDEYLGFTIGGNPSGGWNQVRIFRTPQLLINYLSRYSAFREPDSDEYDSGIDAIIIYKFRREKDWSDLLNQDGPQSIKSRRPPKYNPSKRKRQREQTNSRTPEWKKEEQRAKAAEQARAYRAKLKQDGGKEYERYKSRARQRSKKSKG